MKRIICLILCTILLVGCTNTPSGESKTNQTLDEYLITKSFSLAEMLDSFATNEHYMSLYSYNSNLIKEIAQMTAETQSMPQLALIAELNGDSITPLLAEANVALSSDEREYIAGRTATTLSQIINGQMSGSTVIAASSIASVNESFAEHPDLSTGTIVILFYEGDYAVCVSFHRSMEETAIINATYLKVPEDFKEGLASEEHFALPPELHVEMANTKILSIEELSELLQ